MPTITTRDGSACVIARRGGAGKGEKAVKSGRPRLDHSPDFIRSFASILPALRAGKIGKGEAARRLGISHRSLTRYLATYSQDSRTAAEDA